MEEYFNVNFKTSKKTYFAYLKAEEVILFIFIQNENDNCMELMGLIAKCIAKNFIINPQYSKDNLKKLISYADQFLNEKKASSIDYKYTSFSLALAMSNKSSLQVASLGNIKLSILRDNNVKFTSRLDNVAYELFENKEISYEMMLSNKYRKEITNALGGLKSLEINISGEIKLKKDDNIVIQGIKSWEKNSFKLNEDCVSISVNNVLNNENKIKESKKGLFVLISLVLVIILSYTINTYRINRYEKKLNEIKMKLKIYDKNTSIKNAYNKIIELENEYENMYKEKMIYIPLYINKMYSNDKIYIEKLKENLNKKRIVQDKYKKLQEYINLDEYEKSQKIVKELKLLNIDYLKKEIDFESMKIEELIKANDKYKSSKNNIEKLKNINELIKLYTKYNKKDYLENILIPKKEKIITEIKNTKLDILNSLNKINVDKEYINSKKRLDLLLLNSNVLYDDSIKNKIIEKIDKLKSNIEKESKIANSTLQEAMIYLQDKKYKSSLDALISSKIRFRKLGQFDQETKINETIRKVKELIKDIKKTSNKENEKYKKIELENKILNSIYLSIEKGDELMRENNFEDSYEEYLRAYNFSKKVKIPQSILKKLEDKINYAKKNIKSKVF